VSTVLNSELTSYTVLYEANILQIFFNTFSTIYPASPELLSALPSVLNEVCLIQQGTQLFLQNNPLPLYFKISTEPIRSGLYSIDISYKVGPLFLELARHHPNLKEVINLHIFVAIEELATEFIYNSDPFCGTT
jgi:E3 ubiquitin-protein ligase HUWE1